MHGDAHQLCAARRRWQVVWCGGQRSGRCSAVREAHLPDWQLRRSVYRALFSVLDMYGAPVYQQTAHTNIRSVSPQKCTLNHLASKLLLSSPALCRTFVRVLLTLNPQSLSTTAIDPRRRHSECTPLTNCAEDEFELEAPTSTGDRTCQKIRAPCGTGFYEATAPGPRQDRECRPWTNCTKNEYEISAPNATLDRICTALTQCADGFFERLPPTPSSDRLCFPDSCPPEEYHRFLSAHAATTDYICTPYTSACTPGSLAVKPPGRQEDTLCTRKLSCMLAESA